MSERIILDLFTQFNYPTQRTREHIVPHLHFLKKQEQRQSLLKKYDVPACIHFPIERYGRMFYKTDEGHDITGNFAKRGEIMGLDRYFLEQAPAPYHLELLQGGEAFSLDFRTFDTLYREDDLFKKTVGLIQSDQLYRANRHNELLKAAKKDRIGPMLAQYPELTRLVPKEEIASWMGMSLATFKRHYNN